MSNDQIETKPTRVEDGLPEGDAVVEEQPKVIEITQTDHINKNMLQFFKNRIESGHFSNFGDSNDDNSAMDDEFIDEDEDDKKIVEPVSTTNQ